MTHVVCIGSLYLFAFFFFFFTNDLCGADFVETCNPCNRCRSHAVSYIDLFSSDSLEIIPTPLREQVHRKQIVV